MADADGLAGGRHVSAQVDQVWACSDADLDDARTQALAACVVPNAVDTDVLALRRPLAGANRHLVLTASFAYPPNVARHAAWS